MVQPFTLLMQVVALAMPSLHPGTLDRALLRPIGYAIPALLAGTLAGMALFGRADHRKLRLAALALLFVSGRLMIR